MEKTPLEQILRPSQVAAILAVSKVTLWRMQRRGELPPPIRISPGAVGWRASTIRGFIRERENVSR